MLKLQTRNPHKIHLCTQWTVEQECEWIMGASAGVFSLSIKFGKKQLQWSDRKFWRNGKPELESSDPMDYKIHRIFQARILEWVAFPFSRGSSQPRDWTQVSHIAGGFFTSWATREVEPNQNHWTKPPSRFILTPELPAMKASIFLNV